MRIRLGCEMRYAFPYPVPMVVMLNLHPSRADALEVPDAIVTSPEVPIETYRDSFGNLCARLIAPSGAFTPADSDFHDQILALEASTKLASFWQSDLTFSRSQDKIDQNQSSDFVRTVRPELDWHNVLDLGTYNRLSFGALARRDHVDALSFGTPIAEAKDNDYGYLQDELNIGRHHAVAAVSYLHDGGFGERFDWNAEYGFDVLHTALGKTTLIAEAGTAFHAPTANDRFGYGGNPDLKPEKALNYEAGVKQELGARQNLSVRLFRTDVRDLIQGMNTNDPPFFYTVVNVAHTRSDGVQGTWQYADDHWTARADGIWQNARNRDADTQLLRRARASASAEVTRHLGRYDLGAGLFSSGRRQDIGAIDGAPTIDGGYSLISFNAGARLTRDLRLDARVDNAFNHHYQTAAGYNQPGSAAFATLRYSLPLH